MQTKGDVFTVREGGYLMEGCPSQENLQCSDSLVPRLSPGRAFRTTSNKSWAEARVMRFMCVYKHCYFPCRLQYEDRRCSSTMLSTTPMDHPHTSTHNQRGTCNTELQFAWIMAVLPRHVAQKRRELQTSSL